MEPGDDPGAHEPEGGDPACWAHLVEDEDEDGSAGDATEGDAPGAAGR